MANNPGRAARRTGLVLLAGTVVVGATYLVTPAYDPKRAEAAEAQPEKNHAPAPGSEAALRRVIGDLQRGQPDYAVMSKGLADAARRQYAHNQPQLARLGPLNTLTYMGGNVISDEFRAEFRNGSLDWYIGLGKGGQVQNLIYRPDPMTAQAYIDLYAEPVNATLNLGPVKITNPWILELAPDLILMLVLATFARYVLRVRL